MPTQNRQRNKNGRQAQILKKERQRTVIILSVCISVVTIFVATFFFLILSPQSDGRVFTDGHQAVMLHDDGSFIAELAHETMKGTYIESTADGVVIVTFISEGKSVTSSITDDVLAIPEEWQDDHGHGTTLRLK